MESPGEEKIIIALGTDMQESSWVLLWAVKKFPGKKFCILHVHQPAQEIRIMGGRFKVEALDKHQVRTFREKERKEMTDLLREYLDICRHVGVQAETICIEKETIERGIVAFIAEHGITKLVMGAASFKHYSEKMKNLGSKKANFIYKEAPESCHIWFVCKGNLILKREGVSEKTARQAPSVLESPQRLIRQLDDQPRNVQLPKSLSYCGAGEHLSSVQKQIHRAASAINDIPSGVNRTSLSRRIPPKQTEKLTNPVQDLFRSLSRKIGESSTRKDQKPSSSGTLPAMSSLSQSSDRFRLSTDSSGSSSRDDSSDCASVSSTKYEALLETETEDFNENENKGTKEQLLRERQELELLKMKRDQILDELRNAEEDSNRMVADLVEKKVFSAAQQLVALQKELGDLEEQRRKEVEEFESLQRRHQFFSVFSALDIEAATGGFSPSMKIGEGSFGDVYRGLLRQTPVAIKRFHFHGLEGQSSADFQREIDVLSKVRHPYLVTLIGASPEASSLVFELLTNGSLEDRLKCKDGTPPLPWKTRIRIASEICTALIFLHSNHPHIIVHGDLKPSNILLDENLVCKLGDFGIASFIARDQNSTSITTLFHETDPKGTFAYMDPQFAATGQLTEMSDVYSFGVVLLQLLTGRPAFGLIQKVQCAMVEGTLNDMLDASAGHWPLVEAKRLAQMALRCCEMDRKNRPKLEPEVWKLLRLLEF